MAAHATFVIPSVDKRRWRRVHFAVPIRVTVTSGARNVIDTQGSQMNPGGIGFSTDADLPVGAQVEVAFTQYQLTLTGVIRNRAGNVYGVEFAATTAEENEHLERFRQILNSKLGPLGA